MNKQSVLVDESGRQSIPIVTTPRELDVVLKGRTACRRVKEVVSRPFTKRGV